MNVEDYEEYQQLVEDKADSTKNHYKSSLRKFCEFHDMNPHELILEARNFEPESEEYAHLEKNPADRRLREWYEYLVSEDGADISRNSAQVYWRHIRAFYQTFGDFVKADTPSAPGYENERPDYDASDVRKMVEGGCRTPRDKAIILMGFQCGMDPTEICNLDYGQVKHGLENGKNVIPIWKTRQKTGKTHHVWLLEDGVRLLRTYINNRGEVDDDDPLFTRKSNGKRIRPDNIQFLMRKVKERVGDQIEEAKRVDSSINPMSFKYLRRAFGIACERANIDRRFKEYWLGHAEPYNGAYSGGQISKEEQRAELEKLKPYLSITTTQEEMAAKEQEQDERIRQLQSEVGELAEENAELRKKMEEFFRQFGLSQWFDSKVLEAVSEELSEEELEKIDKRAREIAQRDSEEIKEFMSEEGLRKTFGEGD